MRPNHVRTLAILLCATAAPASIAAQEAPPVGFAELEINRSRECVGVLKRLDDLNQSLQPLGLRAERLRLLRGAIGLEDRNIMD